MSCVSTSPESPSPVSLLARDPWDLKHSCLLSLGLGSGPAFDLANSNLFVQMNVEKHLTSITEERDESRNVNIKEGFQHSQDNTDIKMHHHQDPGMIKRDKRKNYKVTE